MASRERPASAFDTGHVDDPPGPTIADLAEVAEAEAAAAEAEASAATARAHATRLRWKVAGDIDTSAIATAASQRRRLHRPGSAGMVVGAAIMLLCASLAASGYMLRHHHLLSQERQRTAAFATAARQAVATLMSLDFNNTEQDMQRIAGISTGRFKDGFPAIADQLSKMLQASKVVTKATVNDVAVESSTADSAIVLIAATTEATEPKKPDDARQPQSWHIALGLTMDEGQPKMSSIEFVQ